MGIEGIIKKNREIKKTISKFDIQEATAELLANDKDLKELIASNPPVFFLFAIFSGKLTDKLFSEEETTPER